MNNLKCIRCGRTDFITGVPSIHRGMDIVLCLDCEEDFAHQYDKFMKRFLKSKPISHKINDLFRPLL